MNRSHKHQLEGLKSKNNYTKDDLEIAKELLKQDDPIFKEEVEKVVNKISNILNLETKKENKID
jgi:Zn-finger domain-containing protein